MDLFVNCLENYVEVLIQHIRVTDRQTTVKLRIIGNFLLLRF